ncbi:MAG: 3-deoxy-D-manno-octulosonic acid transferase [Nitrospiraceae bacterium]
MWYVLYNVLLVLAAPVILVILLAKQRCRRGLPQRLGFFPAEEGDETRSRLPVIWVHAVSLGEVVAAVPLVRALQAREPGYRIIVTTVTETGREAVEQRLAGVAEHRYAPLDFPWVVSKALDRLHPVLYLFVETEIWPNLLRALSRRGVSSLLVNGRLSSGSFRGYRLSRPLIGQALRTIAYCLMQSDRDASRIRALGAAPERVLRTGNIKFDQPDLQPDGETLSRQMILSRDEELIVAGSTHPGEEEHIIACYKRLRREFPRLVLLLAPRHIERAVQVESAIKARGLRAVRRSALNANLHGAGAANGRSEPRVVILDTRGELAAVYRHAVLSFVGGTLVPIGGHNLLEPALWGIPVFFGPHTDHCFEVAELLLHAGGGSRVEGSEELGESMSALLRDRLALQRMGQAARGVVLDNRGALDQTVEVIRTVLRKTVPSITEQGRDGRTERTAGSTIDSLVH